MSSPWFQDDAGVTRCQVHPGVEVNPARGLFCGCESGPEQESPGEGEQECAAAAERGLPDGLTVEVWNWKAFRQARTEASKCRSLAEVCEERGHAFIEERLVALAKDREGGTVEADNEDQARRWLDLAAKFRQSVAKAIDTQAKLLKGGALNVQLRERAAAREKRARLVARGKGN